MNTDVKEIDGKRLFEVALNLDATTEQVWKTISEGREIARWFAPEARVTPGAGGEIWLSWGPSCQGAAKVDIWEPGKRLRWFEKRDQSVMSADGEAKGEPVVIYVEYILESRNDGQPGCTLRLVHSGFGRGASWDDEIDSIANGWKFELRSLRHYLSRHLGASRTCVYRAATSTLSQPECLGLMLSAGGFGLMLAGGSIAAKPAEISGEGSQSPPPLVEGTRFTARTSYGKELHGRVLTHNPRRAFSAVIDELNDGILRLEVERMGGQSTPTFWLSVWEKDGRSDDAQQVLAQHRDGFDGMFRSLGFKAAGE